MKIIDSLYHLAIIGSIIFVSCSEKDDDDTFYDDWTVVGSGSSASVTKNVLTEFVGSTKCPYCPAKDSLLLSYFDSGHENFVGSSITDNWFLSLIHI